MSQIYDVIPESDSAFPSGARVLLGLFMLGTGVLTFFVPDFRGAFNAQLSQAGVPFQRMSLFVIPLLEGAVGILLVQGILIRAASLVGILLMALMTYLHLVVAEPTFYPLQFGFPFIPVVALVISAFLYFVDKHSDYV